MVVLDGRLEKRQSAMQRAEECRVFIREHHIGYIDWAAYEENQRMIRRNSVNSSRRPHRTAWPEGILASGTKADSWKDLV